MASFVVIDVTILYCANGLRSSDFGDDGSKQISGGRLNKKDGLTRYGDSHVKDKTS